MRFQTAPAYTDCWIRWKILMNDVIIWSGPLLRLNSRALQDTGVLQWPPGGDLPLNMSGGKLNLYARRNVSGTHNLKIDFIDLMATDGFRLLQGTVPVSNGERLVDNGVLRQVYKVKPGNLAYRSHAGIGNFISLQPGRLQRLYFLQVESSGAAPIARTMNVEVAYRPRRTTL